METPLTKFFRWQETHQDMISALFTGYLCLHGDMSFYEFSRYLYMGGEYQNQN